MYGGTRLGVLGDQVRFVWGPGYVSVGTRLGVFEDQVKRAWELAMLRVCKDRRRCAGTMLQSPRISPPQSINCSVDGFD